MTRELEHVLIVSGSETEGDRMLLEPVQARELAVEADGIIVLNLLRQDEHVRGSQLGA